MAFPTATISHLNLMVKSKRYPEFVFIFAIGQDIYASIVVMSLLTTIVTPLVFRNWLFKKEVIECRTE